MRRGDAVADFEATNKLLADKMTGRSLYSSKADHNFHHQIAHSVNNHNFPQMLETLKSHMTNCMRKTGHYLNATYKTDLAFC